MNKMPETVTNKFIELFAVLNNATDDLKMAGAEAYLIGDFSKVDVITDSCRKLQALEAEIKSTVNNFDAKYIARNEKPNFYKKDKNRTRKPGDRLIVKVAGKVIEEPTIAETFVKTLRIFGLERVAKLNKTLASIPLMAKSPVHGYQAQRRCDGWFITTHVNKASATTVLEEIAKELHIPVKVEFIER
ncbi:MAG: hypothetical protein Q8N35_15605 [Methylococcaceae bacterium]|nr:hypothetical protein [Methylococcaceae bacterium]MDZ4157216.1 hypothetical protein [Methylococcales bacterium]MDP2392505.1 hypothetical protein [Methylococcaceae bacterium]MDP3021006.1 hypothetical protein [Methylococcaceae bacterium]MDP3388393.1 hypothetical protein [Methylococcaceae bacterium]